MANITTYPSGGTRTSAQASASAPKPPFQPLMGNKNGARTLGPPGILVFQPLMGNKNAGILYLPTPIPPFQPPMGNKNPDVSQLTKESGHLPTPHGEQELRSRRGRSAR